MDGTSDDVAANYRTVRQELEEYGHGIGSKPEIVALNKSDAMSSDVVAKKLQQLSTAVGAKAMILSAISGEGVEPILRALRDQIADKIEQNTDAVVAAGSAAWSPEN
ncbi:MAG TPA: hypothetical protein EYQ81_12710 [Sneathiellales bacterium]|nr:hypothetical protein [Sneathiellales bacterium]